jgi:adenylate kinase
VRVVLLGPPGAGKGTQANRLARAQGIAHIASGDIFLTNIREETELGRLAKPFYETGQLVPDEVTVGMVVDAISRTPAGFVLDGFPRNLRQAEILEQELEGAGRPLQAAVALIIDEAVALKRIAGRWTCSRDSTHVFNVFFDPPRVPNVCDVCGGELMQRPDQTEETLRLRFAVYHQKTEPLRAFYSQRGLLRTVDAEGTEDEVFERIAEAVGAGAKAATEA